MGESLQYNEANYNKIPKTQTFSRFFCFDGISFAFFQKDHGLGTNLHLNNLGKALALRCKFNGNFSNH